MGIFEEKFEDPRYMCRKCYRLNENVVIGSMESKYSGMYGPFRGFAGDGVWDVLSENIKDPFAADAVYESILCGFVEMKASVVADTMPQGGKPLFTQHIPDEFSEFHGALKFLQVHNPTRMKAIEQLESNYHSAVHSLKQQKRSALSSLQTRQSLEMDMLTNQRDYSKVELEALVGQHIAEVDGLIEQWDGDIETLQNVQLEEYRELVMEVYCSEKMSRKHVDAIFGEDRVPRRPWERPPLLPGTEWVRMTPVAARGAGGSRCLRLVKFSSNDFVFSVINPKISRNIENELDPEELCLVEQSDSVVCGVVLGTMKNLSLRSNQDIQLLSVLDKCPVDCRWPSFVDQIRGVCQSKCEAPVVVTRHSNLSFGVKFILHRKFVDDDEIFGEEAVTQLLEIADCLGIERLFVPDMLVPDLRSPTVIDKSTRSARAVKFSDVLKNSISRLDYRVVRNSRLKEVIVIGP